MTHLFQLSISLRAAIASLCLLSLFACGGGGNGDSEGDGDGGARYTVTPSTGANGNIAPATPRTVNHGESTSFTIAPDNGYSIAAASGCGGTLSGTTYTTGAVTGDCTVTASFSLNSHTVTPAAGANGSVSPDTAQTVNHGETASFTIAADSGYGIVTVTGCGGTLSGNVYTTGTITADCTVTASFEPNLPDAAELTLTPTAIKTFSFSWADVSGETQYRLLENADGSSGYTEVASIAAGTTTHDLQVFLPARINASYILRSCNSVGCTDSNTVFVSGSLGDAVGYSKALIAGVGDQFGWSVALSGDGTTLAVGAPFEDGNAIDGADNNNAASSGAVYVFTADGSTWSQQAYLKASNNQSGDEFGFAVTLSADGNTLAVGAPLEDGNSTGVGGPDNNDGFLNGAVYVFTRNGDSWSQRAYVKASNPGANDRFGIALALSGDGTTLAVAAIQEGSSATGIDGPDNDSAPSSGAVYVFTGSGATWSQQAFVKASNTALGDMFGSSVALSSDGNTLAVGATGERSSATGIDGDQGNNDDGNSGAVYVFTRSGSDWSQQAYVKASNSGYNHRFGGSVALSGDGTTLAVGSAFERSSATGIDGDQTIDSNFLGTGAVYVLVRSDGVWSQQAYVKASNTDAGDQFGWSVALAGDGNTLAVGARFEESSATGIGDDQSDNSFHSAGAIYVYSRSGAVWSQQAYVKATNTGVDDQHGASAALSGDGTTLAVGAILEDSNGIDGPNNDNAVDSGAVYLY